jgi:hypothetical protein
VPIARRHEVLGKQQLGNSHLDPMDVGLSLSPPPTYALYGNVHTYMYIHPSIHTYVHKVRSTFVLRQLRDDAAMRW